MLPVLPSRHLWQSSSRRRSYSAQPALSLVPRLAPLLDLLSRRYTLPFPDRLLAAARASPALLSRAFTAAAEPAPAKPIMENAMFWCGRRA